MSVLSSQAFSVLQCSKIGPRAFWLALYNYILVVTLLPEEPDLMGEIPNFITTMYLLRRLTVLSMSLFSSLLLPFPFSSLPFPFLFPLHLILFLPPLPPVDDKCGISKEIIKYSSYVNLQTMVRSLLTERNGNHEQLYQKSKLSPKWH